MVPLSKQILFDAIPASSTIVIDYNNNEFTFNPISSTDTTYRIDENGYIVLEEPIT